MMKREEIIRSLLDQARDKDHLDDGRGEIFAEDAVVLREAAQLLNMDADLRDQYECAIQANTKLANAKKTTLEELAEYYGLTPDGVQFALEQYQRVICEITHNRMSKLSYFASDILSVANDVQCDECELKEPQEPVKPNLKCSSSGLTWWYECGVCGTVIDPHDNYCRGCGEAVSWE
jgi:hypothetical protein